MSDDLHDGEKPVEPILSQTFEGMPVTGFQGVLPMVTLDMPEGYPLGTHLRFEVEVRVANVRYEEGKGRHKADFTRRHVLVTEGVELKAAFIPSELDTATYGTATAAADLVEDEEEAEQVPQDLPLDPAFAGGDEVEVPGAVESLDEQITRMAEEEAQRFAEADEEERARLASARSMTTDEMRSWVSSIIGSDGKLRDVNTGLNVRLDANGMAHLSGTIASNAAVIGIERDPVSPNEFRGERIRGMWLDEPVEF